MATRKHKRKDKVKKKILVIDDSCADREIFKVMLQNEGYAVKTASDGAEGFSVLYEDMADLILCDYFMPGMNGEEFLLKLRKDPKLQHLGVIIITSDETKEVKIRLLRAGANDFLHKGAAYEEIVARIGTHLRAKELSNAQSVLEFASSYAHEMSEPLASFMAAADVLKEKVDTLKNKTHKQELMKVIKKINTPIDEMTELINKLRKLNISEN